MAYIAFSSVPSFNVSDSTVSRLQSNMTTAVNPALSLLSSVSFRQSIFAGTAGTTTGFGVNATQLLSVYEPQGSFVTAYMVMPFAGSIVGLSATCETGTNSVFQMTINGNNAAATQISSLIAPKFALNAAIPAAFTATWPQGQNAFGAGTQFYIQLQNVGTVSVGSFNLTAHLWIETSV